MNCRGDILDDCLNVPFSGYLVVAISTGRLMEAVVVKVELLAALGPESRESIGAYYGLGPGSEFGP